MGRLILIEWNDSASPDAFDKLAFEVNALGESVKPRFDGATMTLFEMTRPVAIPPSLEHFEHEVFKDEQGLANHLGCTVEEIDENLYQSDRLIAASRGADDDDEFLGNLSELD